MRFSTKCGASGFALSRFTAHDRPFVKNHQSRGLVYSSITGLYPYSVSRDGQRFLMIVPSPAPDVFTVVLNWTAGLKK
jgi:hypothetical protein